MPDKVIRIGPDVYAALLTEKARLEKATGQPQSFSAAIRSLLKDPAPARAK